MKGPSNEMASSEEKYAGLPARVVAYVLDCLILFGGLMVLQTILFVVNPLIAMLRSGQQPTGLQTHLWVSATVTLPAFLYFGLMLRCSAQATLAMRLLKIRVTDVNGGRISSGQALLRSAVLLVPFELNHSVMFHLLQRGSPPSTTFWLGVFVVWVLMAVYIVSILMSARHQSVHDLVAGTVVRRAG